MRKLVIVGIFLGGSLAIQYLGTPAAAQPSEQKIVPGELIVGYQSEPDRQSALQQVAATKGDLRFLGGEAVQNFEVESLSGSALKLGLELPARIRALAKTDPNARRALLRVDPKPREGILTWTLGAPAKAALDYGRT